jgi:hypothetical protein
MSANPYSFDNLVSRLLDFVGFKAFRTLKGQE